MRKATPKPPPKPRRKAGRKDAMLRGGFAVEAAARAVRRCQAEGLSALRAPLPEARHEAFCLALFCEPTVTAAAVAAGYSPATAKQQGSRLLTGRVDLRRRIFGLYEGAFRSVKRRVLEKGDALVRATERHGARRLLLLPVWRLVGKTAEEVGRELEALSAEGWDISLVDPAMKLCREEMPALDAEGRPLTGRTGGVATRTVWVSRCEGVRLPDEQAEEAHMGRFLGWVPERDTGDGERELSRLKGELRRSPGGGDGSDGQDGGATVAVIETPEDGEPLPRGDG